MRPRRPSSALCPSIVATAALAATLFAAGVVVAGPRRAPEVATSLPAARLDGTAPHLRVFNANILYCDPLNETPAAYRARRTRLVERLVRLQPDVIVLQEVSDCLLYAPPARTAASLAAELAAAGLSYEHRFWESEGVPGVWREGLAFLWNRRRVALAGPGVACRHLAAGYWLGVLRVTKSVCQASFRPATSPPGCASGVAPVTIVNTHLDARRDPVRDAQAAEAARLLARTIPNGAPALLAGDLNGYGMERFFAGSGWWRVRRSHVDYLLARGLAWDDVLATRVVPLRADGVSDHDALSAEVRWTCRPPRIPELAFGPPL